MSDGRILQYLRSIVREFMAETKYHGLYEYRAAGSDDTKLDLIPVRAETGLPALAGVPMRTGLAGATAKVGDGVSVLVAFVDGDPSRPVVISYGDPTDPAFESSVTTLAQSSETDPTIKAAPTGRVVRYGDTIQLPPPISAPYILIPATSSPTPVSRVKA